MRSHLTLFVLLTLLISVVSVDRYLTDDAIRQARSAVTYNQNEMTRIYATSNAQYGAGQTMKVARVLADDLDETRRERDLYVALASRMVSENAHLRTENQLLNQEIRAAAELLGELPGGSPQPHWEVQKPENEEVPFAPSQSDHPTPGDKET